MKTIANAALRGKSINQLLAMHGSMPAATRDRTGPAQRVLQDICHARQDAQRLRQMIADLA